MNTEDLIECLRSWLPTLPRLENEGQLHAEVLGKLKAMNMSCKDRAPLPSLAGGVSRPDILVTSVDPQLLIEIKANGKWKLASQAAWQLFQAAEILRESGTTVRRLAIFGGVISDPLMHRMLSELNIASIEQGDRNPSI